MSGRVEYLFNQVSRGAQAIAPGGVAQEERNLARSLEKWMDRLTNWVRSDTMGVQYALVAEVDGHYPDVKNGGSKWLAAGDVWKYGETTQVMLDEKLALTVQYRYSAVRLSVTGQGVLFVVQEVGTVPLMKMAEQQKLFDYRRTHGGDNPPGNPVNH